MRISSRPLQYNRNPISSGTPVRNTNNNNSDLWRSPQDRQRFEEEMPELAWLADELGAMEDCTWGFSGGALHLYR
jgi:hypothetical protein